MTEAPRFIVKKISVPLGSGIWTRRWAVLQDDVIRDWFTSSDDARVFANSQERNWESQDE